MNRFSFSLLLNDCKTVITAHSGCENTAANSREHILAAIESGCEMVEVDVRMADGLLYLSHDLPGDYRSCVTLRECFSMIKPQENLGINIDAKTEGLPDAVLALASKFDLNRRIIFTGSCNSDRARIAAQGSEMWRSMWDGDRIADGIQANMRDGSPLLNVHYPMITDEYDRTLRATGGRFSAWTVDDPAEIRRFLEAGIGNITTRKPHLAMTLRREIQGT